MNSRCALSVAFVGLMSLWPLQTKGDAQAQEKPIVQIPQPGVPQIITMEGKFVRASYNNEGYVILGYQASNRSIGDEWMLLEVGMTVLDNTPDYRLTREAISLETPDGKTIPLPTITEQREGQRPGDSATGEGPARFHQLLSDAREPGVRPPLLSRPGIPGAAVRRGGSQQTTAPVSAVSIFVSRAGSPTASIGST